MRWSSDFAYAVGLLATDGCLSGDGRHIDLTSKDREQIRNFKKCLGLKNKIGRKWSGAGNLSWRIQFGDVVLYRFLKKIGLTSAKSKTLGALKVPKKLFFDFLRGVFDGDGSSYSYYDPRWRSSFMFYISFASASPKYLSWLQLMLRHLIKVKGHITKAGPVKSCWQLKYAKHEAIKIARRMYCHPSIVCLSRKRLKIEQSFGTMGLALPSAQVVKLVYTYA